MTDTQRSICVELAWQQYGEAVALRYTISQLVASIAAKGGEVDPQVWKLCEMVDLGLKALAKGQADLASVLRDDGQPS